MVAAIVRHLQKHGLAVLPITAEVQAKKRFGLIQEFSRSPDVCAIVASLNCLNRGFTITAANHVILVDLEYSPEATEQAEDRVHRPGQTKPVHISYLLSRDTIDQVMHEILVQKAQAIRHAIDGKARFEDVAEILKRVTGDVQMEIAKRIQLLPPIVPDIQLQPLTLTPIVVPDVLSSVTLDERIEPFMIQIPTLVKQLSLFGL
jgi:SNF2 family DNA or RNA helicase